MGSIRRRSDRPDSARRRHFRTPEELESRQLLSTTIPSYLSPYLPSDLYVTNPVKHYQRIPISIRTLNQQGNPNSPLLSNQGKIVTGKDRQGNEWTITVHGPGRVIVTDTTPNDGSLDDDIATIQIVNSNPKTTYVTGNVVASARTVNPTSGTVNFNRLIALNGVHAIDLYGFDLNRNVSPMVTTPTGVFLYGGVSRLRFHDIVAAIDTSVTSDPYTIQIGRLNVPLTTRPSIYLDSIYNSVFDSSSTDIQSGPLTTPSVQFLINGVVQNFSVVSVSGAIIPGPSTAPSGATISTGSQTQTQGQGIDVTVPSNAAAYQFRYTVVGTTGRTALEATAANGIKVVGRARNFTASRTANPNATSLSGMKYIRHAAFGGNADAVSLNAEGKIGSVKFKKGLGDPTGVFNAKAAIPNFSTSLAQRYAFLPASNYGIPAGTTGYPAAGLLGGIISASQIGSVSVLPANDNLLTAQNPDFVQLNGIGSATYYVFPGTAVTNSAITSSGSIGSVDVTGDMLNSEVKSGFDYTAYVAGLQGTRAPSTIYSVNENGALINSVVSATFIPANNNYSNATGRAGNGTIKGHIRGRLYNTGGKTALGNTGVGFYARSKSGYLPSGS